MLRHMMASIAFLLTVVGQCGLLVNAAEKWPGGDAISDGCEKDAFEPNLSGIIITESSENGWAVQNSGYLFKIYLEDSLWLLEQKGNWGKGKRIVYPDGGGIPDAEDLTMTDVDGIIFVCTERNDVDGFSKTSKMSILSYDISSRTDNETTLIAVNEWDVTKYLPEVDANKGLEAITWISDSILTKNDFLDKSTDSVYDPKRYPNHGNGLFFVGLEGNGKVYAFALEYESGEASLVTDFKTEESAIMSLHFDPEVEYLWTMCDDTCSGRHEVYTINDGKFNLQEIFDRPGGMKNLNNEGFTMTSEQSCMNGVKPIYWTDDGNTDGISIRSGTVQCGNFLNI